MLLTNSGLDFSQKKGSKFFSLTVDCCSMSQQGGGLEMGKMIEEQHVQVLQHDDRFKFWGPPGPNPLILPSRLVEGTV